MKMFLASLTVAVTVGLCSAESIPFAQGNLAPITGPDLSPGRAVLCSLSNSGDLGGMRRQMISTNGHNIVGIVIRQYLTSSGILEAFTWTNGGDPPNVFTADPNLNSPPPSLRYPHIDFSAPDGYGFVTAASVISTFDAPYYIRNSGGYGSGLWDAPVQIRPTGEQYQSANGFWLGNSRILVSLEASTTGYPSAGRGNRHVRERYQPVGYHFPG